MNKKNLIIGLAIVAVIILGVVLLVPRDSSTETSAANNKNCPPTYGYDISGITDNKGNKGNKCKPKPRPLLYDLLNIGE